MGVAPGREVYCPECRRMVDAYMIPNGVVIIAKHYRFSLDSYIHAWASPCHGSGSGGRKEITFGMEDPKAAYKDGPRSWGVINQATATITVNISVGEE